MSGPRFSIIIPTRNRASLLRCAIRSALAQRFDDFEVVVVNNASTDGTAAVCESFSDLRMRVVHSTTSRLMHENWAFAVSHARGQFVLVLCDDDAWHPRLLEIVHRSIGGTNADVLCWRSVTQYSADWLEPHRRGVTAFGPPFSDRVFQIDADELIDAAFDMRITITDIVPRMLNSAVSAELIHTINQAGIELFRPCNPDYSCFMALALHARKMVYLDAPLLVSGATPHSVGASASQRGETARRFLDDLLAHEPDLIIPPEPRTPAVWIGQTYMQCAREIPALEDRNLNAVHMYGLAGIEIERFAGTTDVSDWRRELDVVLAGPCAQQCDEIRAFITNGRSIETDRFLKPADVGAVLETEPRFCCDGNLHQQDRMSIDQVALNLDSFLEDAGVSLANLWDDLAVRCGQRMCVIAGLGLNGRAILRMPPPRLHPLNGRLRSHDDRSDAQPSCAPRVDGFKALDPRRHFVLVTPTGHAALSNRLSQQGFSADDWTSLAAMAAGPSANNINAAGVGIPSGCR